MIHTSTTHESMMNEMDKCSSYEGSILIKFLKSKIFGRIIAFEFGFVVNLTLTVHIFFEKSIRYLQTSVNYGAVITYGQIAKTLSSFLKLISKNH